MSYVITASRAGSLLIDAYGPFPTLDATLSFIEACLGDCTTTYHQLHQPPTDVVDGRVTGGDLAGLAEAAGILNVSRQRVSQLAKKKDFPPILVKLAATPVWRAEEVARYGSHRFDPS